MNSDIQELVQALPECYQPIYGHPELVVSSSRNCDDRLSKIENIFVLLKEKLGRPLRLLDLGCAQGFFSFNLAKHCSKVTGIDFLDKNIALCNALRDEQGSEHVTFKEDKIQNVIDALQHDDYDIVLGFSVFHHICDADGYYPTKEKINKLANIAQIVLLELAVKEEGLYWGRNLPDKPLEIVDDIGYFEILGEYSTHLSEVNRPLLFTSSKYWYLNNELEAVVSWMKQSHEYASDVHQGSRRYYFSDTKFLKRYALNGALSQLNRNDYKSEISSINTLSTLKISHLVVPELLHHESNAERAIVVTSKIDGARLSACLEQREAIDEFDVVKQLVMALAELESHQLYHNDVRIWNILKSDDQYNLIDFGAISAKKTDVLWPYNNFLSFIIFINELNIGNNYQLVPSRTPMFSPFWAKTPKLASFLSLIWSTGHKAWSFKLFVELLNLSEVEEAMEFNVNIPAENVALWMFTTETLINESRAREFSNILEKQNEILNKVNRLAD
ncbi:methyltransferase domain-containing protein [Pantoea eucalypti]|jgi:O-antigen chain-terminating methyltransferase|uniref:methyltransferase domain-containing protein n=1 Tax=Pantoea eucalypti TaxID=470933 RepID=UPI00301C8D37